MRKVLFLGIAHDAIDSRLYYRLVYSILDMYSDFECIYAGMDSMGSSTRHLRERYRILDLFRYKKSGRFIKIIALLRACIKEKPDWIQASDVREIIPALIIKLFTGSRLIYDSHEDYFNQAYEYSGKTIRGLVSGSISRLKELIFIRFINAVFCTDDYLYSLYKRRIFGARRVFLLRNFVNLSFINEYAKPPDNYGPFRLVYVGGVNEYRGVIECADYVDRYNKETGQTVLTFDVYAWRNSLVDKLVKIGKINYRGELIHPEIFKHLGSYHAGVSLLKKINKFARNIAIKNFEYMAVGLPVITSDFGVIGKYVSEAEAGICIDPDSYPKFRDSVNVIRNTENWKKFSKNGRDATLKLYQLEREIGEYISIFSASN
jgi:glycosyltransferase involved in cell wall biosynthesis